ncbi:hypothetical protein GCM10010497_29470 [Streptomyces cinereoruber]|uniref:Sec-independent protein translocase TatA n=1 Tax=Streptomyces cinereoruber TaxID=67260 RepID=A0AAV4KHR8_9ACTN|nr:hypothetical protein [Streptomyces cinereoruber]MBB4155959.1 hypothetical protein [Streptomyces cinereoruber]MBY8816922.1 hypothetical protein [Streptomyces cinereoruber]NIH64770.1 hypothetical protein [Streptomyces cinereoruber]QEV32454.1 hypothetical protein CP977_09935 [Streptomyces cinereoruber]GGR25476.1 hypothetical protein GCM10010497_29470 [Streptomyces cinereoruber]
MTWDKATLFVLALFGLVILVLAQVGEVLTRLPRLIRAWRDVRNELRDGNHGAAEHDTDTEQSEGRTAG